MELEKTKVVPSTSRKPFFDGTNLEKGAFQFKCTECGKTIKMGCFKIYRGSWEWKEKFNEDIGYIKSFFGFDKNNIALTDGGWPSISEHSCNKCNSKYLLFADFHEWRNSAYRAVAQGVAKIKT